MFRRQPYHDRLVVRRIKETETAEKGIRVPATAKERPQKGEVLAVGNDNCAHNGTKAALDVRVGDKILFGRRSGIDVRIGGEDVLILSEDEFLVVLASSDRKETGAESTSASRPHGRPPPRREGDGQGFGDKILFGK